MGTPTPTTHTHTHTNAYIYKVRTVILLSDKINFQIIKDFDSLLRILGSQLRILSQEVT